MPQVPKCGFAMSARLSCRFWFPIVTDIWRMWRWVTRISAVISAIRPCAAKASAAWPVASLTGRCGLTAKNINGMAGHLNGGVKGFAGRLWESRVETNRVVMSLSSDDGDQGYPGNLQVEAAFDFDEDNALEITYIARTDRTTPVNMACNLLLNLGGEGSGSVLDHELRLDASTVLEADDRLIPTGKLLGVAGTPADFRSLRRLGEGVDSDFDRIRMLRGYDHFFPVDGWRQNILTEVGELRDARSGLRVEILSSQPGVTLYTGNRLGGGCPETKSGGRYRDYEGVAVVCQGYPDAVNRPEFPSPLLAPDGFYCQKTVYRFGTFR
jgi:aldose 1-epimerase